MTTDLSLFSGGVPAHLRELLDQAAPMDNLTGGRSNYRRLSIRGGVFREILNGAELSQFEGRSLNVVILQGAPISRAYYDKKYNPNSTDVVLPLCWSDDTNERKPSPRVPAEDRQCDSCDSCEKNIKGSGDNDSRACRFQQRIAIMLLEDLENREEIVFQMSVPATSLFSNDDKKMGLQAYCRYLGSFKLPACAVATQIKFDSNADTPKLNWAPARPLTEQELAFAIKMQTHPDTIAALAMDTPALAKKEAKKEEKPQPVFVQESAPAARRPAPAKEAQVVEEDDAPQPVATRTRRQATPPPAAEVVEEDPVAAPVRRRATTTVTPVEHQDDGDDAPPAEPVRRARAASAKDLPPTKSATQDLASIIGEWVDDE